MRDYPKHSYSFMQSFFLIFIFFSLVLGYGVEARAASACPPLNWDDTSLPPPEHWAVVKRLTRYYHSDQYIKEVKAKVKETLAILERAVKESSGNKKLAIVSDIDDTVLGSYDVLEKISYGFYMPYFEEAIHKADFPAIKPMYDVMKFAKKNNITVFYVTGRKKVFQEPTEKNLKEQGFDYFETVFYKPADYREKSVVSYKSGVRKQIEAQGYEVVLSIGDQQSDLSGGHAVSTVKLPNYMYFIP